MYINLYKSYIFLKQIADMRLTQTVQYYNIDSK